MQSVGRKGAQRPLDDGVSASRRWEVTRLLTDPQRARKALRGGFQSVPSLTVAYLFHRMPIARRASSPNSAPVQRSAPGSSPRVAAANGTAFAGYTILRPLGSGGMADVYLAKHPRLPRHDVLKVLAEAMTADSEFRERFNREADLAAALWHPHIVGLHDRGEFDGHLWISMDYVEGTDASRLVKERYRDGMPIADVCDIVSAVAGALDYAHDRGLLHRDVKPANILLTNPDAGERRILLADFGVARHLGDISGITETNVAVGTVAYAAPEQLIGSNIDGRADQYALAATAFHLLTGAPPYRHSNPVAVIGQHLHADPPRLSDHRPDLAHLDDVFFQALAKNKEARFKDCRAFAGALSQQVQAGGTGRAVAGPRDTADTAATKAHRSTLRAVAIAVVFAMVIAVAITWSVLRVFHADKPDPTRSAKAPLGATVSASSVAAPAINGAYRLDYDREKQTSNGVIASNGVQSSWWAFRSSCRATGCAATATKLDDASHEAANTAGGGGTDVLRFVDGHWQGAPRQQQVRCRQVNGTAISTESKSVVWSLTPQADGTLRGVQTETVQSNECGAAGSVLRVPVVATRIGDVPPNVTVADPAKASNAPVAPAAPSSAPTLGGPCTDTDKLAYDSTANAQVVCEDNTWDKAPTTTGVHSLGTSCDEPDIPVFAMSMSDDGHLIECDPATRVWARQHG
ncbi:MAG: serine/threonine protein kinase [Mycobacterium sp.]|nr:serine/threonine protein kinase [Mycobacterium sp.]